MSETSLAVLSATALTEGVKFLYRQAGEVLERWRERRAKGVQAETAVVVDEGLLGGDLGPVGVDYGLVEKFAEELSSLRAQLEPYLQVPERIVPGNDGLLRQADALRMVLEVIYGHRLTFCGEGEHREPAGTVVIGRAIADRVSGYVAGLLMETREGISEAHGEAHAKEVREGGQVIGTQIARERP